MSKPAPHITPAKKKQVEEIKKFCQDYPVIGLINLKEMPSPQLQKMRHTLRDKVTIRMLKGRILKIAFDQIKEKVKGIDSLREKVGGMPAVLFTKEDPFKLYKTISKSKSSAPAKAGQKAPRDLMIPAGPTPFTPGPIIGELGQLGIKTEIKEGKIFVRQDTVIAKEGQLINAKVASLLQSLGVQPMEIGLNLTFALENGLLFGKDVLSVNEEEYINNIKRLSAETMNLAVYMGYTTKETTPILIRKAVMESRALAEGANILTSETTQRLLQKAEMQFLCLKKQLKLPEEKETDEGRDGGQEAPQGENN